jgi:peroxiredoxin
MTQLGELRDAYPRFREAGVKLYAVSYDDHAAQAAFAEANQIPFPLLSDADSAVIRRYGILNTLVREDEVPFHGIPFPGTYVVDERGVVVEKFFPRHLANRESADSVLESALGELLMGEQEPRSTGGDDDVRITAFLHGGGGVLKSGVLRRVVVRFELPAGMHVYGEPVPDGMVPTTVAVRGPEGLVVGDPILPPTSPLTLEEVGVELHVWSGTVDVAVPVFVNSHMIDLFGVLPETIELEVEVRYQACTDRACLIPRSERLSLEVPFAPLDVPNLPGMRMEGQRRTSMDSLAHFKALVGRFEER